MHDLTSFKKNDLSFVIEQVLEIDGLIKLREISHLQIENLALIQLWVTKTKNGGRPVFFGNDVWTRGDQYQSVTFSGLSEKLVIQSKSLFLGMITHGAAQGNDPIKWSTATVVLSHFKRFGTWLNSKGINSIEELDKQPLLKVRNLVRSYLHDVQVDKHPSVAIGLSSAIYWSQTYSLLNSSEVIEIFRNLLAPHIKRNIENRQKHSIIPTRIMTLIIKKCSKKLKSALKHFEEWKQLQKKLNNSILKANEGQFNNDTYIKLEDDLDKKLLSSLHKHFNKLRSYVFVLVLAFSGMRHSEAIALEDFAAFERDGRFYIVSNLSKTTDEEQELEWVVNKMTFDAVTLLSKMNSLYRERASLLTEFFGDKLPQSKSKNMVFGAHDRRLFRVKHCKQGAEFPYHKKSGKNAFNNANNIFKIAVTESDIQVLENMDCNIASVSANRPDFRQPYEPGILFNFTSHQFRHTFAWFIVANRLGDLDDIKYQFKHLEHSMSLVYSLRGYETMDEMLGLTKQFEQFVVEQYLTEAVESVNQGNYAGKGGKRLLNELQNILGDDMASSRIPHFSNLKELISFISNHVNLRGLSHGYCLKGTDCKIRNAADPSHCIACDTYLATPKHLPQWQVLKNKCEDQLERIEKMPVTIRANFSSFKQALTDNLNAANQVISKLTLTTETVIRYE